MVLSRLAGSDVYDMSILTPASNVSIRIYTISFCIGPTTGVHGRSYDVRPVDDRTGNPYSVYSSYPKEMPSLSISG